MYIPCVKCPGCGRYNDFAVGTCRCGASVVPTRKNRYVIVHYDEQTSEFSLGSSAEDAIPAGSIGQIRGSLIIYEQICKNCGSSTYLTEPQKKVRTCWCCTRVINTVPAKFVCPPESEAGKNPTSRIEIPNPDKPEEPDPVPESPADLHFREMHDHMVSGTISDPVPADSGEYDDNNDDDDENSSWGFIGDSLLPKQDPEAGLLSLLDVHSHSVLMELSPRQAEQPVMLGREAGLADFLIRDDKTSRKHCTVFCNNGKWFVKDEMSANGVFVNGKDIGLGGTAELADGDILQFGHDTGYSPVVLIRLT